MTGSAEAVASIERHVEQYGVIKTIDEIMACDVPDRRPAGRCVDVNREVAVSGLDTRFVPAGFVTGQLACRAVMLSEQAAELLAGDKNVRLLLRTRFTYDVPAGDHVNAGTVAHAATYALREGDGAKLDEYFDGCKAYTEAVAEADDDARPPEAPHQPDLDVQYTVSLPGVPDQMEHDDGLTSLSHTMQLEGFAAEVVAALQAEHPEADILSSKHCGEIRSTELPNLAAWLIQQA